MLICVYSHENVIEYKESFLDFQSQTLCLVMEYAEKGDILKRIDDHHRTKTYFDEQEIWSVLVQSLSGLKALHDLNIMHRDIKCANILISSNDQYKLADFNVSKVVNSQEGFVRTQTGTPYYASPEVWRDMPYDFKSDVWSMGCVIYEMAALMPPFKGKNMHLLFKKVTSADYKPLPNRYSAELREIVNLMLQPNPNLRPTCTQLLRMPALVDVVQCCREVDKNMLAAMTSSMTVKLGHSLSQVSLENTLF